MEMMCGTSSGSVAAGERRCETAEGCANMCGMCPPCVFAHKPPGSASSSSSSQRLWKMSEVFKRRFMVELLLRCTNVQVLESIQNALDVTSWTLLTYARSSGPTSPREDHPCRGTDRALDGKPLGVDLNNIWDWFDSSPDWMKLRYLFRLFSRCDSELLRMASNLTSVLLARQKRGFQQLKLSCSNTSQHDGDTDDDSEDPALMVVPGSSKSLSGVSRYRDFVGNLPVHLSKRILGLLDEHTLRSCQKVCQYWQHLANETLEEIQFRRHFQGKMKAMMKRCKVINKISPTYANITEVLVPTEDDEEADVHPSDQKGKPFEAAYAKIKTKTMQMEERNVYCGAYFTKVLLDNENPHRVLDYRGGSLMATGSRKCAVHLFHVASETTAVAVMKGHISSIRAVLLLEDRDLVITAGCDASIRFWDLKTDQCDMVLYGHMSTVTCLDVHADRLVSGSKDYTVKVWDLHTGKHCEDLTFKHPGTVQCVKISTTKVYSSCSRGLVKIWDMETASLLRVVDAHRSSVKCLFFDEWHLLSGDVNGQVMAWSISCHAKERLMTFSHPKEVKSLTLVYLRVVTGCVDGKIRIFNFLTGDCLRYITAEEETGRILSLHFLENCILVNTTSSVKLYQFAKVFWDYTESAEGRQDHTALVSLPSRKTCSTERERAELLHRSHFLFTPSKCHTQAREGSLMLSEKATRERMKKRGHHHPLTRDSILLRVSAIQRAQCTDEVSVNMEHNARLRDSWGPHTPQDPGVQALKKSLQTQIRPPRCTRDGDPRRPRTSVPVLKRGVSQNTTDLFSTKAQPHSTDSLRGIKMAEAFTTGAK